MRPTATLAYDPIFLKYQTTISALNDYTEDDNNKLKPKKSRSNTCVGSIFKTEIKSLSLSTIQLEELTKLK